MNFCGSYRASLTRQGSQQPHGGGSWPYLDLGCRYARWHEWTYEHRRGPVLDGWIDAIKPRASLSRAHERGTMPFNLRGPELLVLLLFVAVIVGVGLLIVWLVKAASKPTGVQTVTPDAPRPAGWYPLTDGSGRVAWWDGHKWTDPPQGNDGGT